MVRQDPPGVDEARLLPEPFWTADRASVQGRRLTVRWYRGQIVLLVVAAVIAAVPGPAHSGDSDIAPLFSVAAFVVAGYCWYRLRQGNPQRRWHEARAAAESVKALAWKYTVRARPFEGEAESAETDQEYLRQVGEVLLAFEDAVVLPPDAVPGITEEMRRLRAAGLSARRGLYLRSRVEGQRNWYRDRAAAYESQSVSWGLGTAALIIVGGAAAVAQATGALSVHLFGTCAAAAAAIIAWTQLTQLRPLATTYRLAARELDLVRQRLSDLTLTGPDAETRWSELSADAEDAVSREHTTWRAKRAFPR
ncbi:DUF4231 domain-containing protein [Peterkaempfera bronchialis]|uniref:DUF4231 domain-containing protein n=1 Tax=Peterkaempfera bronchialis TaxID=2126346 RepID=A0A345SRK8_9ACTN|nr:DUF4231 domain-containing protein [Peterkaempfera bronchialis]AXI76363.1 DUF4231 domain-containing protein [Peterkaempfera bronchialis]